MIIKHNKKVIPLYTDVANTFWKQLKGLMFDKNVNHALIFQLDKRRKISVHTLFMHKTIDIVFVRDNIICDVAIMNPWGFYSSDIKCDWFVELPSGTLRRYKIRVGDVMKW